MPDPSSSPKAVFLSYAREDAEAARRIADALRAFGVEVWFDQNELRGGDAWDQKIRSQIRTCALCIPMISATTQARGEGYFRREWKIAVERMQDMASGVPYLLPVVIDDTRENEASVPEEFLKVQWTRMPRGVPSTQFVEQVRQLLDRPRRGVAEPGRPHVRTEPATGAKPRATLARTLLIVVPVCAAIVAGFLITRKPANAPVAPAAPATAPAAVVNDKSIAVLPFTNMSDDKDSGFFADGIHEDILTNLALIHDFRVVSRTSVMPYRTTTKSMRQIARELGVAYILEGSVRRAGNKVRVTGQLIHAATDEHVWAQAYDRDLSDIFAIQAELSKEIAGALKTALSPEEKALIAHRPTENTEAYDLYLRSRDTDNHGGVTLADLTKEEALSRRAVELDPAFAAAWGQLAREEALFSFWGYDQSEARQAKAKEAIDTALRLAPDDPAVIDALGAYLYYGHRDFAGATAQYERLRKLQPNDPSVASSLGLILRREGHFSEALPLLRKATQLDPGNAAYSRNLAEVLFAGRRYEEFLAIQRRRVEMLPERLEEAYALAATPYRIRGSTAEGDRFIAGLTPEQAISPRGIEIRKDWAAAKGDWAEVVRLCKIQPFFEEDGAAHYVQAFWRMNVHLNVGDKEGARAAAGDFPNQLRADLAKQPRNIFMMLYLAGYEACIGDPKEGIRLARKAVDLLPESQDAVDAPVSRFVLAMVYARAGDKDHALEELAHCLRTPFAPANVYELRKDGAFSILHGDPRFEALLADPANNAPLF